MRVLFAGLAALACALPAAAQTVVDDLPGPVVVLEDTPSESDFTAWSEDGAGQVINLLTLEETEGLDFDLPNAAAENGLAYANIPVGENTGAEAADQLALLLAAAPDRVVINCASSRRAAHVYAAAMIRGGQIDRGELDRIDPDRQWSEALLERLLTASESGESLHPDQQR